MSLLLFAAAGATAALPIGDPRRWITSADYPAAAITANADGPVRVTLVIDPDGKPSACTITLSSGDAALDAQTCRLLRDAPASPRRAMPVGMRSPGSACSTCAGQSRARR